MCIPKFLHYHNLLYTRLTFIKTVDLGGYYIAVDCEINRNHCELWESLWCTFPYKSIRSPLHLSSTSLGETNWYDESIFHPKGLHFFRLFDYPVTNQWLKIGLSQCIPPRISQYLEIYVRGRQQFSIVRIHLTYWMCHTLSFRCRPVNVLLILHYERTHTPSSVGLTGRMAITIRFRWFIRCVESCVME